MRGDRFRGFAAAWEVPAEDKTAERGRRVTVPGKELFEALKEALGEMPFLAEDLGAITPDVHELRDEFGFPGMRVLQFAFSGDPRDTHLPHNYDRHTVVYTGTLDNDTVVGWFESRAGVGDDSRAPRRERAYCMKYLRTDGREIQWDFIAAAHGSVSDLAVAQLQDVLGLGSRARMNTPAVAGGNWAWRFEEGALTDALARRLREVTETYGRLPGR